MAENQWLFKVTTMSRVLQVCRSGYYRWRKRGGKPSVGQQQRLMLDHLVKEAFEVGKGRSGAPRLVLDLIDAGHHYDRKTVANSLRRQGLRAKAARSSNQRRTRPTAYQWLPTC